MHANITVLNKQFTALILALFVIALIAGPTLAQEAVQKTLRPLHITTIEHLSQPVLRDAGQASTTNAWTIAASVGTDNDSGAYALFGDDRVPFEDSTATPPGARQRARSPAMAASGAARMLATIRS